MKLFALLMLLVASAATAATQSAMCSLDYAKAVPCRVDDRVTADGVHQMVFTIGRKQVRFSGKSQTGWWSGSLGGKPAMGLELNRGHTRFATTDLATTFDWWLPGQEHGTY